MNRARSRTAECLALLIPAACLGCGGPARPSEPGVFVSPQAVLRLHRVVFVELGHDDRQPPEVAAGMTGSLFQAIQGAGLFHVDVVNRTDHKCFDLPIDKREPWTIEELSEMRTGLKCDAVLFGWVNRYQPYPRMKIGLYLRLLDLKDGRLVWGVDRIWDTTDRDVELRIRDYYYERIRGGYEPPTWRITLMSPSKFRKFVAYEVAGTLPSRDEPGRSIRQRSDPHRRKVGTALKKVRRYY